MPHASTNTVEPRPTWQTPPADRPPRREVDDAKLAALLREYRSSRQADALTAALYPKMLKLAKHLAQSLGLPFESADEAVQDVFAGWQKQGSILAGWSETGGASVMTWTCQALLNALRNLRDKEGKHQARRQQEDADTPETGLVERQPGGGKSQSSYLRVGQLSAQIRLFAAEMVGQTVHVADGKATRLTENHRAALEKLAEFGDLTDQELADALGVPKATAGRWKLAVHAFIRAHPRRRDILELLRGGGC